MTAILFLSLAFAADPTGSTCLATPLQVSPQASIELLGAVSGTPEASALLGAEAILPIGYQVVGVSDAITTKSNAYVVVTACRPLTEAELKARIERLKSSRCEQYRQDAQRWMEMGWPTSDLPPAPEGCQ